MTIQMQEQWVLRIRNFIRGKKQYLLALLLLFAAATAGIVLHHSDKYSFYYFGDAASHIIKAREFLDSQPHETPFIGTVWLPLPHLLLLPFASIHALLFLRNRRIFCRDSLPYRNWSLALFDSSEHHRFSAGCVSHGKPVRNSSQCRLYVPYAHGRTESHFLCHVRRICIVPVADNRFDIVALFVCHSGHVGNAVQV